MGELLHFISIDYRLAKVELKEPEK